MSEIEELIQSGIENHLSSEYLIWNIYSPTKNIPADFSNIKESMGAPIESFKGSRPSQKPKQVVEANESGDAIIQSTIYKIDILNLPAAISKKHLIQTDCGGSIYEPTVALGKELIGSNVSLEIKLVK